MMHYKTFACWIPVDDGRIFPYGLNDTDYIFSMSFKCTCLYESVYMSMLSKYYIIAQIAYMHVILQPSTWSLGQIIFTQPINERLSW